MDTGYTKRQYNRGDLFMMNKAKFYRELAGLTQQEVANAMGLSKSGYALKEQGKREFSVFEGLRFAQIVKQPINAPGDFRKYHSSQTGLER